MSLKACKNFGRIGAAVGRRASGRPWSGLQRSLRGGPSALAAVCAPSSLGPNVIATRLLASSAAAGFDVKVSAPMTSSPPFKTAIIYNQSKHSCQSVLADIRAVWGTKVRVVQTLEEGLQKLPGMDSVIYVRPKSWGDMEHFDKMLQVACTQDHALHHHRMNKEVVFMPGWSAFAESSEAAVAVEKIGLVWPGTEPVASQALEKIGFKRFCEQVGAPTPPFVVLAEEDAPSVDLRDAEAKEAVIQMFMANIAKMNTKEKGLIKSIHGGGGKGTAHLDNPQDTAQVRASIEKVLNEMNRSDGIYFEEKVNQKGDGRFYQIEIEVDGTSVAHGGRFVWFNSRLQKVVEIGLSDPGVAMFMPAELYQKSREWSAAIAKLANNNTRATMEALVFNNEHGVCELQFIECNRRPQVENEALALLQQDSNGQRRYTFAELMMRARGFPAPDFVPAKDIQCVLHARWLHGNPDHDGNITYQAGTVLGMEGPRLDYVAAELLAPGDISFTSDPQLGKAVITASSWPEMCDRAVEYFKLRKPLIQGSVSTYAQTMQNLFSMPLFREGKVASNETFKYIEIPEHPPRELEHVLKDQVAPVLVSGYRPGEGIDPDRFPTERVCGAVSQLHADLAKEIPTETAFTEFARGDLPYEDWISELKGQLRNQGGGWVTVAPRDTAQQGNDSESAGISALSRRNAEVWAQRAGCIGYETGGAQYQAGLIRGFDPCMILLLGLPFNMPAHSLQRSQYVNGLAELTPAIRQPLFDATANVVTSYYRRGQSAGFMTSYAMPENLNDMWVPWHPYNFHAGNFFDEKTGYSPQDQTTGELLESRCIPIPNWVFSPKFPLSALEGWTGRQIDLFQSHGLQLSQLRIKNPGQGKDWTPENVWAHIKTMLSVFEARKLEAPVIYIHNHDFNGLGGHVGRELLLTAQKAGYSNLVIDAAYRKNGTHNDNTIVLSALSMNHEQKEALEQYNHEQQQIEQILCRFDSRTSQMTPWDSDWAGGTEGSDLRIAKEYSIDPRKINHAKEVASEVFPLERAVTPFSEYKLRLGIAIMIEEKIEPKSVEQVKKWVNGGGKLKVGGDVLVGLKRWETLVPKTPEVDKLLMNMAGELDAALAANTKLIGPDDLPQNFSPAQVHNALGYQQKGLDFAKTKAQGADLTPLLTAPHVLHRRPLTLPASTRFDLLHGTSNVAERATVEFAGFGTAPNGDILMGFLHKGKQVFVQVPDPNANVSAKGDSGPRKATPGDRNHLACIVPGEVLSYSVKAGDVLQKGMPLCVLESMKMEMKISVPDELDGMEVKSLPCLGRTKEKQGDILKPGDLLLELQDAKK